MKGLFFNIQDTKTGMSSMLMLAETEPLFFVCGMFC